MRLSEVLALIGAGFTKEEIETIEKMEGVQNPAAEPASDPEQEPPKQKTQPEPADNKNEELLAAITGLTKALQVSNIRNTPQPASVADNKDVEAKADKALMEIYNL